MLNRKPLSLAVSAAIGASAAFSMAPAIAQNEQVVEEVVVTGSRLQTNPNLVSATPVLSVTGEEAQIRGNTRVEDFINVLPQAFAAQASETSNGATGTAQLNLRGLGAVRTLVLINGRRLPYGSSSSPAANLDLIPTQLVERVDIVTGGASAVYGSDAVSGVANFVLKKDFEGIEIGGQYGANYNANDDGPWDQVQAAANFPSAGSVTDGEESLIYGIMGVNTDDGRGNLTFYASYEDRQEILQGDRAVSACALGTGSGPTSFAGYQCGGSSNFRSFGDPADGTGRRVFLEDDGTAVPFTGGAGQLYNFGPVNFFQRPSERYQFSLSGHYEVAPDVEAYTEFQYTNNVSDAQIAPTATFSPLWNVNCDNPFIQDNPGIPLTEAYGCTPEDIANGTLKESTRTNYRNVEGGGRNSRLTNTAFRWVGGLEGSVNDVWRWNVFAQYADTSDESFDSNYFVADLVNQALNVVLDDDGNPVCRDQSGGCVPYNIFQRTADGQSLVTQEALDFIQGVGVSSGSTTQTVFGGDVQTDLGEYGVSLPWTDAGVGLLVGLEYRKDELDFRPDQALRTGGLGGAIQPPVSGEVEVSEFFTEVEVPIITDAPLARELTFRGQYRYSRYEAFGNDVQNDFNTNAYGASLSWAPISDVKVRAQYQRAVRAPNVVELYDGLANGLPNLTSKGTQVINGTVVEVFDPCSGPSPLSSFEVCARTGVTEAQYGSIADTAAGQAGSITGGNPNLDPEVADTVTFGVVITPEALPGLTVSIDYFDIEIEDAIAEGVPAQVTFDNCLAGNLTFCDFIRRGPRGDLEGNQPGFGFVQTQVNIAQRATSGVDLQANYSFDLSGGHSVSLDYASTILDSLALTPFPGGEDVECAGFFGNACQDGGIGTGSNPEYRHRLNVSWFTPWNLQVIGTWRYFGETDNDDRTDEFQSTFDAVNYLDLTASYDITDNITARVGALNLLGEQPPVFTGAGPSLGNGNTYPTIFEIGTQVFGTVTARF